jgi:hypothetical protein
MEHGGTDFTSHWVTLVIDVDNVFNAASIPLSMKGASKIATKPLAASTMELPFHRKLTSADFDDFKGYYDVLILAHKILFSIHK